MLATIFDGVSVEMAWYWAVIGYVGQIMFGSRIYVQWLASERHKRSVVPNIFWWLSLVGSVLNLIYAVYCWNGPFILGTIGGPPIYARNLWMIHKARTTPPSAT
jgi:lipid-A-disaccharide synthase-like uncharacterized protein